MKISMMVLGCLVLAGCGYNATLKEVTPSLICVDTSTRIYNVYVITPSNNPSFFNGGASGGGAGNGNSALVFDSQSLVFKESGNAHSNNIAPVLQPTLQ